MRLLITALLALSLAGCGGMGEGVVTLEEFNKIQIGMSPLQVTEIIGEPGKLSGQSVSPAVPGVMGEMKIEMWSWQNADGSNIIITFQNDKVESKHQAGL